MKIIYLTAGFCLLLLTAQGQDIATVLRDIERNNLELQAMRNANMASAHEQKGLNALDAPSVEYSPFFRKGAAGVASSELVVSQEFDFPTLYAGRAKSGRLQREALEMEWKAACSNTLLMAKLKCLDLIMLCKVRDVLQERIGNAEELLTLFEKRMKEGDATSIELNRIRMETMDLRAELLQQDAAIQRTRQELLALNANRQLSLEGLSYPEMPSGWSMESMRSEVISSDVAVRSAMASVAVSEQEVRVTGQGWMPRLSVGYRRNTEMSESSNGFLVGASFPVFSNGSRVKAAKARRAAAKLYLDNARVQAESETDALLQELRRMDDVLKVYDLELLRQSLDLLKKAVTAGSMSLIDYYTEADKIYQKWQTYLTVEHQYHTLWATLKKNNI